MRNWMLFLSLPLLMLQCSEGDPEKEGDEKKDGDSRPMAVDVVVLEGQRVEQRFSTTGDILANEQIELRSPIAGEILEVHFEEGEKVRKGEKLLRVDDRGLKARRKRLKSEKELAEKELERMKELIEVEGVSQEELDRAENKVSTLAADIQELEVSIDRANIEAPFSGRIGLRDVSPGAMLDQGTRIAELVKERPLKLDMDVPSDQAQYVRVGDSLRFTVDGVPDGFRAKVIARESGMEPSTRSLQVRALVEDDGEQLMPGAFVRVDMLIGAVDSALMVPSEALIRELNSKKVWVIRDGKAESVKVETGMVRERALELREGVEPGDSVLVTGLLQVREGMPLRVRDVITPRIGP